jgi:hypothetical protein
MTVTAPEIVICAKLCKASYEPNDLRFVTVGDLRFGVLAISGDTTAIAFRGSANTANWIRNFFVLPARTSGGYLAHAGFISAVDDLKKALFPHIPTGGRIVATGHSFGAAIALLFGEILQCPVITFGGPRVYWRFGRAPWMPEHLRIVCDDDPIPMVPRFLFRHLNKSVVLRDRDGIRVEREDHDIDVYIDRLTWGAP